MKKRVALLCALLCVLLAASPLAVRALDSAEPGKSLWGFKIGQSRRSALAQAKKQFSAKKQFRLVGSLPKSRSFAGGLTEDLWNFDGVEFAILYKHDVIIQLRKHDSNPDIRQRTFSQLLKRHKLQKKVYGFGEVTGTSWLGFYYDDLKRGVCFSESVQDVFVLTAVPDGVIIHKVNAAAIAIEDEIRGETVTGEAAMVFKDMAAARRYKRRKSPNY